MSTHITDPPLVLTPDELDDVAEVRAQGGSWDAAAKLIDWDATQLKRAARRNPDYDAALAYLKREADEDTDAELQRKLRSLLRSDDPFEARKAAEILTDLRIAKERNQTKIAIARIRAEKDVRVTQMKCDSNERIAQLKAHTQKSQGKRTGRGGDLEPEQIEEAIRHFNEIGRRDTALCAEQAARGEAEVYLWGGCHPMNQAPNETDTPLQIIKSLAVTGQDKLYWAATMPPPVAELFKGPFLPPPGCRPPTYPFTVSPTAVA